MALLEEESIYSANDPYEVVNRFKGRITFWAGADVQYLLPRGTADEERKGIRNLIDIFDSPDGGLIIAAGKHNSSSPAFDNKSN